MMKWQVKKLGELSIKKDAVVSGPFGSNLKVSDYRNEGVPILRLQNIGKGFFIDKDIKFINEEKAEELKYHSFLSGDIALAKLGIPIGKTCIIPKHLKSGIITADIVRIRPDRKIVDYNFLEYFLNTDFSVDQLTNNISGATRPRVNLSDVRNIKIPLPPLPEQQRIVSILDECFAAIDKAKANAEQNLRNAKELFNCILDTILYDEKWQVRPLGEVCEKVEYGTSSKARPQGKLPVLRMGNIQNGRFVWDSLVYSDNEADNKQYLLKYNDVLFNRTNSRELVGKTAIYKGEMPAIFAGYLIRIHRREDLLDADYLNYYLNSRMATEYGSSVVVSSVNQANINGTKLKAYPIPLPTLQEQQAIVRQLDALRSETQKLEAVYQKKINDLEELKKSILQKAFAGELTAEKSRRDDMIIDEIMNQ